MRISDWSSDVCSSDLEAAHALAVMHPVAHGYPVEPFVGGRSRPARDDETQRIAVDVGQRPAVHREDEEAVLLPRPVDGEAAEKRLLPGVGLEMWCGSVIASRKGTGVGTRTPQSVSVG